MIPNRVVIDTNVCLGLFVFRDPRWERLLNALQKGLVEAVTRQDCRREWEIVLGYSHLPLDDASRPLCLAQFDALIRCLPTPAVTEPSPPLPLCRDRDDQKFLELARDTHAAILITKDKALLKLAGKCRRAGLFEIMPPERWSLVPAH